MESKYRVEFAVKELDKYFYINSEARKINFSSQVRELREDLRSIVIDEAIRAGEHLEELQKLPAAKKEQLNIKKEARARARQVSLDRYGDLRVEAFNKLDELTN